MSVVRHIVKISDSCILESSQIGLRPFSQFREEGRAAGSAIYTRDFYFEFSVFGGPRSRVTMEGGGDWFDCRNIRCVKGSGCVFWRWWPEIRVFADIGC
jgi:hypothetical protein